jgi:hypothetical protein
LLEIEATLPEIRETKTRKSPFLMLPKDPFRSSASLVRITMTTIARRMPMT